MFLTGSRVKNISVRRPTNLMHREDGLIELRYAKYATIDHYGVARIFASLRDIQGEYDVNFTTANVCKKTATAHAVSVAMEGGWR